MKVPNSISQSDVFGPYVHHSGKYYSLKKTDDPMTITAERAIELIEEKREIERNRIISNFEAEGIMVCNGRYGAYIAYNDANYKIPKDKDPKALTAADCQEIIKAQGDKKTGSWSFRAQKGCIGCCQTSCQKGGNCQKNDVSQKNINRQSRFHNQEDDNSQDSRKIRQLF
jgi:topoisomerase IA-like protein